MKSKQLTINGVNIIVHSDGSITKPFHKRNKRTFGYKHMGSYMRIRIGSRDYLVHRLITQAFLPDHSEELQVDHIDGKGNNNDIRNLRMASDLFQKRAHKAKAEGCSSQYRGVCWHKGSKKWLAQCKIEYKGKHIGYFDDEYDAAIARDAYAFSHGFPLEGLNFPEKYTKCA